MGLLAISLESVGEDDVTSILFNRQDTRSAAGAFLDWLKESGGRCSKAEMNHFSHMLSSGELGCRLSRTNFYKTILHRFLELGLIGEQLEYDHKMGRTEKAYKVIVQPIPGRRPMAPSLTYLAHVVAEKWNKEFARGQSKE